MLLVAAFLSVAFSDITTTTRETNDRDELNGSMTIVDPNPSNLKFLLETRKQNAKPSYG